MWGTRHPVPGPNRRVAKLRFVLQEVNPPIPTCFVTNVENGGSRVGCDVILARFLCRLFGTVGIDINFPNHPVGFHVNSPLSERSLDPIAGRLPKEPSSAQR